MNARTKLVLLLSLIVFVSLGMFGSVRPSFAPVQWYSAGNGYGDSSVAYQDLNGDGKIDLVVSNYCVSYTDCDGSVSILLGKGDGTFQAPLVYASGGFGATSVAIADVNGDLKPDILVTNCGPSGGNGCGNGSVGVLLGNGDGTFQAVTTYSSGGFFASAVAVGDLNGDGKSDVVVTNGFSTNTIGVLLGNGDGTFQSVVLYYSGSQSTKSVAIADLNGDGKLDVVVTNCSSAHGSSCYHNKDSGSLGILLGNGDGTLQAVVTYPTGGASPYAVKVADVNADGKPDLLVANECSAPEPYNCAPGTVGVLMGNGDGTFQAAVTYSSGGAFAVSISAADLNGDGNLDIVVPNYGSRTLGVLLGNGDGTFQKASTYYLSTAYAPAESVAVVDLNGDGRPDIVVTTPEYSGYPSIGVLLNITSIATTTTVTSSVNPSTINQPVTFTARVTSTKGVPPEETVAFFDGAAKIGASMTAGGVATFQTTFTVAKIHTIKAKFPGSPFFKASSGIVKQIVNP
jgi:hypothetical protein